MTSVQTVLDRSTQSWLLDASADVQTLRGWMHAQSIMYLQPLNGAQSEYLLDLVSAHLISLPYYSHITENMAAVTHLAFTLRGIKNICLQWLHSYLNLCLNDFAQ